MRPPSPRAMSIDVLKSCGESRKTGPAAALPLYLRKSSAFPIDGSKILAALPPFRCEGKAA